MQTLAIPADASRSPPKAEEVIMEAKELADGHKFERCGEPAGTRTQGPRLNRSKRQNYQWLDFATVSPFFMQIKALMGSY
jgi:hypothetical protein